MFNKLVKWVVKINCEQNLFNVPLLNNLTIYSTNIGWRLLSNSSTISKQLLSNAFLRYGIKLNNPLVPSDSLLIFNVKELILPVSSVTSCSNSTL